MQSSPRRRIGRFLLDWAVPPALERRIHARNLARQFRLTPAETAIVARNARLRDMYAGRRCFVIGNGPSLADQDLRPLGGEVTVVMNHFFKHPILEHWQPTVYCAADPVESYGEAEQEHLATAGRLIDAQAFVVHLSAKSMVERRSLLPLDRTYYFWGAGAARDLPRGVDPTDLSRRIVGARTTAHLALIVALYLGCSPIYLLGLDHDWLAHRSVSTHFYAPDPGEEGGSDDVSTIPYKTMVENTLKTWELYELIHDAARARGAAIFNATAGGFLDVFPRARFETVVAARPSGAARSLAPQARPSGGG